MTPRPPVKPPASSASLCADDDYLVGRLTLTRSDRSAMFQNDSNAAGSTQAEFPRNHNYNQGNRGGQRSTRLSQSELLQIIEEALRLVDDNHPTNHRRRQSQQQGGRRSDTTHRTGNRYQTDSEEEEDRHFCDDRS